MAMPTFWSGRRVRGDRAHRLQGLLARDLAGANSAPRSPASACRRRPSRRCSPPAICRGGSTAASPMSARASCWRATSREAQPEVIFHLAAQPLVLESLQDPRGDLPEQHPGHGQPARRRPAPAVGPRDRRDHQRQMLPAARPALRRGRCAGRPSTPTAPARPAPRSSPRPIAAASSRRTAASASPRARAGNVIGGGDFSPGRLLPDLIRAFAAGEPADLRHPQSVRPWQHVLDALARLSGRWPSALAVNPASFSTAWNFGPDQDTCWTAARVAEAAADAVRRTAAGAPPPATSRSRCRCCCCPPTRPSAGSAGGRGSTTERRRGLGGRRLPRLLRQGGTRWLVEQIHAFEALRARACAHGLPAAGPPRAAPCLRLSPPTSRSSSCAAASAPGWATAQPCAPSRCSTSARSRCCSTSWPATAVSAFAASSSAPAIARGDQRLFRELRRRSTATSPSTCRQHDQLPPARAAARPGR